MGKMVFAMKRKGEEETGRELSCYEPSPGVVSRRGRNLEASIPIGDPVSTLENTARDDIRNTCQFVQESPDVVSVDG